MAHLNSRLSVVVVCCGVIAASGFQNEHLLNFLEKHIVSSNEASKSVSHGSHKSSISLQSSGWLNEFNYASSTCSGSAVQQLSLITNQCLSLPEVNGTTISINGMDFGSVHLGCSGGTISRILMRKLSLILFVQALQLRVCIPILHAPPTDPLISSPPTSASHKRPMSLAASSWRALRLCPLWASRVRLISLNRKFLHTKLCFHVICIFISDCTLHRTAPLRISFRRHLFSKIIATLQVRGDVTVNGLLFLIIQHHIINI